jgi:hypothetical protein
MKVGLLQQELWRLHAVIFRSTQGYRVIVYEREYRLKTLKDVLYLLRVLERHASN